MEGGGGNVYICIGMYIGKLKYKRKARRRMSYFTVGRLSPVVCPPSPHGGIDTIHGYTLAYSFSYTLDLGVKKKLGGNGLLWV